MRKSPIKMLTGIMAFCIAASMGSPCYAAETKETTTEESRQSAVSAVDENGNKVDTKKSKNEKSQLSQNKSSRALHHRLLSMVHLKSRQKKSIRKQHQKTNQPMINKSRKMLPQKKLQSKAENS